ncbi:MAG: hypothetical protein AAFP70_19005, partial [Calditrichota bacterium]
TGRIGERRVESVRGCERQAETVRNGQKQSKAVGQLGSWAVGQLGNWAMYVRLLLNTVFYSTFHTGKVSEFHLLKKNRRP